MKNLNLTGALFLISLALSGCASTPQERLQAQLDALPAAHSEHQQSPVISSAADIFSNTTTPTQVPTRRGKVYEFADYERELTAVRKPTEESENALRSLSYFVGQSVLGDCNQVCGLRIEPNQGVPGQFMTFNCNEALLNLRDYYDTNGKQGFTLSRDKVNLLIGDAPAWLKRTTDGASKGSTFLAWRGADRGFALFSADASDATVERLINIAQSINQVQP